MILKTLLVLILLIICVEFVFALDNLNLTLKNDGPAILDSQIRFFATIDDPDYLHEFVFQDNTRHSNKVTLSGGQSVNYTYKYESGKYQAGVYTMKVKVHRHHERMVAFGEMKFNLTENMVGEIIVQEDDFEDTEAFAVNKSINFTAVIYDPNGFFLDRQLLYFWDINNNKVVNEGSTFLYNFTTAGDYRISVMIIAIGIDGDENFQDKFKTKWGHFTKDITVKEPISKINVSGNTWLKHGDLLNINVSCDGSGPSFEYCWEIVPFNESKANFTCIYPIVTTTCNFIIVRYFHEVGLHYIKTFFSNYISSKQKTIEVRIYDVSRQPQLSTVIIPIVCSVLTIVIIIMGIAYHIQQRKKYSVEVADFDFHHTEDLVEKTFFERLRDSFKNASCRTKLREDDDDEKPLETENSIVN
ncbi:transmembrane protein 130-like [Centruroides vittatus]|uniref:transmembrane protein 130-like n=1 Tax=Centruroides vittatus TaxID=120091 RepID=UPI00350F44FE